MRILIQIIQSSPLISVEKNRLNQLSSSENKCIDNCEYCLKEVIENKA